MPVVSVLEDKRWSVQILENPVEQSCKRHADKVGAILLKIEKRKGWPDRLLLFLGFAVFIEFKRPGAVPEPLQQHWLNELNSKGQPAIWITSLEHFKSVLGFLTLIRSAESSGSQSERLQLCSSLQDSERLQQLLRLLSDSKG